MTDILWVDPVGHDDFSEDIRSTLQAAARPDTNVDVTALDRGPHHVEYRYYEALVTPDVLHTIKRAENEGYDATVIGCFYDLGLDAGREVSALMPVVAPAEAATHLATTLGASFSVVVGRRKWIPQMRERIHQYGFDDQLASFRPIDLGVLDFQADPAATRTRLLEAARAAVVEDGAEVVVLGCTIEYGFYEEIQDELGVPVLDAVTVPFKYAEWLADLTEFGWTHSNVGGYESPLSAEIDAWGIEEDYADAAVWTTEET